MTEEESREALFKINQEYMSHTPKERLELYDEYKQKREFIRSELIKSIKENSEDNSKKI